MLSSDDDLPEIRAAIRPRVGDIAEFFRGPPNRPLCKRHKLRFGSKGSLEVIISGAKQGLWHDREADCGGDRLRPDPARAYAAISIAQSSGRGTLPAFIRMPSTDPPSTVRLPKPPATRNARHASQRRW